MDCQPVPLQSFKFIVKDENSNVQQWRDNEYDEQLWTIDLMPCGNYTLSPKTSDSVLSVETNGAGDGENVILMLVEVKRDNPSEVYYMVEGGRQGVFRKAQGEEYVNFLNDSIMLSTFGYLIKDSVNFYENYDEIMEAQTRQRIRQNHGYINVTETDERVLDEDLREWYQVAIDGSTEINENELKSELESRQRRRQKNFDYDSLELDESLLEITGYPRVTLDELRAIEDEAVEKLFREKTKEEIDELNPWDVQ